MVKATKDRIVVPNILKRKFKQVILGKVILTDITYIKYIWPFKCFITPVIVLLARGQY